MYFRGVLLLASLAALILLIVPLESFWIFKVGVDSTEVVKRLREGLAEALVVAVFLALTVDTYVKRKLGEDIARNISSYMMVSELPPELRNEFHELTRVHLYRTLDVNYKIERVSGEPNKIRLTCSSSFTLHNVHGEMEKYPHFVAVQKPIKKIADLRSINNVSAEGVLNAEGYPANYDQDGGEQGLGVEDETKTYIEWSREVFLPAKGHATFHATTTQILPDEHQETFVSVLPTTKTTIRVDYPADITVTVKFGHRLRDRVSAVPKGRPTHWTLNYAMLLFQPVMIEWRKAVQADQIGSAAVKLQADAHPQVETKPADSQSAAPAAVKPSTQEKAQVETKSPAVIEQPAQTDAQKETKPPAQPKSAS